MKLNFKKIASVLAGTVMLTSTIAFAAAANYPTPFSASGGAVVYGAAGLNTDVVAAYSIQNSLKPTTTTGTTVTTTGETAPLFTGSTQLYVNDSLNTVKSILTSTDLPTVLAKGSFSGNVDATYTQTITVGSNPTISFGNYPTSSDPTAYALKTSSSTNYPMYNASVSFSKAVNFTSSDSKNQEIDLFGQKFTVGADTDSSNLVLFQSSSTLNFDSTGTTSGQVTINDVQYTIELSNAYSTNNGVYATIIVTTPDGTSKTADVLVGDSKTINGLSVAVSSASSSNQKYTASIVAGSQKVTLTNGAEVTTGDNNDPIDGTLVTFTGTTQNLTALTVGVAAADSDHAAILQGQSFTDPVFGSFKLDFSAGMSVADNDSSRESIVVTRASDDKSELKMNDVAGNAISFEFAKNYTSGGSGLSLQSGDTGQNITVMEGGTAYKGDYMIVGNEDSGRLLKVYDIYNSTSSDPSQDRVTFQDVASGDTYSTTITSEGSGLVTIGGKTYVVTYNANTAGASGSAGYYVNVIASDAGTTRAVYPTIESQNLAKVALYKPLTINLTSLTGLRVPDGNGYTTLTVANNGTNGYFTLSGSSVTVTTAGGLYTASTSSAANFTAGQFTYTIVGNGTANYTTLSLDNPSTGALVTTPAVTIIEGKDDNNQYQGLVIPVSGAGTSTAGVGPTEVARTYVGTGTSLLRGTDPNNSNLAYEADLYGSIITIDSTNNQKTMTISYPKGQIYGQLYMGSTEAVISGGSSTTGGAGSLMVVDDSATSLDSVKDMNLIVVGGSCVNIAAAKILGSDNPICGADFTTATQVTSGQYIIKSVASPYNSEKVAVLVAGYEAVDTVNAVNTLLNDKPSTDVGTSQVYPIESTAAPASQ